MLTDILPQSRTRRPHAAPHAQSLVMFLVTASPFLGQLRLPGQLPADRIVVVETEPLPRDPGRPVQLRTRWGPTPRRARGNTDSAGHAEFQVAGTPSIRSYGPQVHSTTATLLSRQTNPFISTALYVVQRRERNHHLASTITVPAVP